MQTSGRLRNSPLTVKVTGEVSRLVAMSQPKGLEITTLQTLDTEFCADATEWCPIDGFQDILLCGTYQLQEREASCDADERSKEEVIVDIPRNQVRVGRLYIYQLEKEFLRLQERLKLDMPGVLDIKWSHQLINGRPTFGLVNSVGQLRVYQFMENQSCSKSDGSSMPQALPPLSLLCECQFGADCLGLSLEWSNQLRFSEPSVAATDSNGFVSLFKVTPAAVEKTCRWKCQDFEAWITAFNQWDPSLLYTGGDDCQLKVWDLRIGTDFPVLVSRRHTMGVCSVQSNPIQEHIVATGSYDEQLCIWDSRQMRRPVQDIGLGGGIWRIKWEPWSGTKILTATMYSGFHLLQADSSSGAPIDILSQYTKHESIAYGADWYRWNSNQDVGPCKKKVDSEANPFSSSPAKYLIASCSFYDHSLHLWECSPNS
ncbi:hypothetical protein CHS0354_028368 [Potamilus streckersoni]|uniref:methylated diphthine methylhydrolase n=1 Tax=Potamilus streckersoni TaxID=2493646 RepID=A0AAE0RTW9_9BIVA|nr:hypothetical protein CHS0354_028368 [Potamilus streckersoni]